MKGLYWIISGAVTLAGIGMMGAGGAILRNNQAKGENLSGEVKAQVEKFDIQVRNSDLQFIGDDSAKTLTYTIENAPKSIKVKEEGGVFSIQDVERRTQFFHFLNEEQTKTKILVVYPSGWETSDTNIELGSGDGRIENLTTGALTMHLGSGSLEVKDSSASGKFDIQSGSGEMSLSNSDFGDTVVEEGSGQMTFVGCDFQSLAYDCGSGDLILDSVKVAKDFHFESGSGHIKGGNLTVNGESSIEVASGEFDVDAFTPGSKTGFTFGSGDIQCSLTGKQEDYSFNCTEIGSGEVTIGNTRAERIVTNQGDKLVTISGGSGSIDIGFLQ